MSERPSIPPQVKREVRQRCGFGCVLCGSPIFEYDHMIEWSKTHHHRADELTLLCSKHHAEKTKKILPIEKVMAANAMPHNRTFGVSSPQSLYYDGKNFKLKLGGSVSTYSGLQNGEIFAPFAIDGKPVVSFTNSEGNILLNVEIRDENGTVILLVDNSELIYSTELWDVEWVGQILTIREGLRKIFLELQFSPPSMVSVNRASLRHNGVELEIGHDFIFCLNNSSFITNCAVHGYGYGFAIGDPVPAGNGGIVFSGIKRPVIDREAARRYMNDSLKKMRDQNMSRRLKDEKVEPTSSVGKLMFGGAVICYDIQGI